MSSSVTQSVVLPNGDVWRPRYGKRKPNIDLSRSDKPKTGMEALGNQTDCPWCGMECKTKPALLTHVRAKHKSALEPSEETERQAAIASALRTAQ